MVWKGQLQLLSHTWASLAQFGILDYAALIRDDRVCAWPHAWLCDLVSHGAVSGELVSRKGGYLEYDGGKTHRKAHAGSMILWHKGFHA